MFFHLLRCLAAATAISVAWGQQVEAPLTGVVRDASGAPIAGVRISVSVQDATLKSAFTGGDGRFELAVPPGEYRLTATHVGFSDLSQTVEVVDRAEVRLTPHVAPVRESVTVIEGSDYVTPTISSATRTPTPLRDIPQAITVISQQQIRDQLMAGIGDVVRYVPGMTAHQGENNRDQVVIRGNSSSADFYLDGVRDDVQYYRDLYNLERVEALKGPNAMIFGRGGGGGVINRVSKEPSFMPLREVMLQGGSFGGKRIAGDFDQPLSRMMAVRFNGMYENSGSFRDFVNLERFGISPSVAIGAGATRAVVGYEHFEDKRVADRGISSYQGRPLDVPVSRYFGNPDDSRVRAAVNLGRVVVEHQAGRLMLRNRTLAGGYDRAYQNYVPGAVAPGGTQLLMSAYNSATARTNVFNQTDGTAIFWTGGIRHTVTVGTELGGQFTDNFRNTGYFNNTATSILIPVADPLLRTRATFRQSATDADNHVRAGAGAVYAQDQITLNRYVQVIAGARFDHFDLKYHNNRTLEELRRIDNMVGPRVGVVLKPAAAVSIYGSRSVSYLPSSGDQFASLTAVTQQLKPERFTNYEAGVKWDISQLSLSAAVYRLDRTNTRSIDPNDPTRIVQTGSQRTNGVEVGVNGRLTKAWEVAGGYALQDAFVTSATAAARLGAVPAMAPRHTFSLWNHYRVFSRLSAGLGILNRTDMFAGVDNTVVLPGYTRADAAVFYSLTEKVRLQANVENVTNRRYYANSNSNTNISPGSPVAVRVALTARF